MSDFVYAECRAFEAIGVSASAMRKVRKEILDSDDWSMVPWNGRCVVAYTRGGMNRVVDALVERSATVRPPDGEFERILSVSRIEFEECSEKKTAGDLAGIVIWKMPLMKMVVVKKTKNPRIMLCRIHKDDLAQFSEALSRRGVPDGLQRVKVKSHDKFVPGMEVEDCAHEQTDLWVFTGKLPRYRGRF